MNLPLTQLNLDLMLASGCGNPECRDPKCKDGLDELYFHSRCHPNNPTVAARYMKGGMIQFQCGTCRRVIVEVTVAKT